MRGFSVLAISLLAHNAVSFVLNSDVYLKHLERSGKNARVSRWRDGRSRKIVRVIDVPKKRGAVAKKEPRPVLSESGVFETVRVTNHNFTTIGGYTDVKEELTQIVDFLRYPGNYTVYNVRLPRGVLLSGAPGTGKTLLAKCLAGEAGVSFVATSGTVFQEKYVGVGSARIRELFSFARSQAPCVVFIDEIDALGRKRSGDGEVAQTEKDGTLNQLLVEMDGFRDARDQVVVLAATNRPDVLDPALLRPGRLDKLVQVGLPDDATREEIINIHARGKPLNVTTAALVRLCSGMSGAQIEGLLNEATLLGIREGSLPVNATHVDIVFDRMVAGRTAGKRGVVADESLLWRLAVHEAGHCFVACKSSLHPSPDKVTVRSPSGSTLGFTLFLPANDSQVVTKRYLEEKIQVLLGGYVAESVIFAGDVSTGAKQDLEMCQSIAEAMVTKFGMGEKAFPVDRHQASVDASCILQSMLENTFRVVENNLNRLLRLADLLVQQGTLNCDEITGTLSR